MFSIINVFLDSLDSRVLNLFLIPDIRKTFKIGQDYFNSDLDKFILTEYQKNQLLQYIEKSGSKLISTDIKIIDPAISKYVLNISIIAFDDVDKSIIKKDIQNSVGTFFIQNTRRNRIPKSDLIKLIEEVNGVDSVSITIVSEKNEKNFISTGLNQLNGLDEFNDIICTDFELPIIRGGFRDRFGNFYSEGLSNEELGSLNVSVKQIVQRPIKI
jgi:hypothetical protein